MMKKNLVRPQKKELLYVEQIENEQTLLKQKTTTYPIDIHEVGECYIYKRKINSNENKPCYWSSQKNNTLPDEEFSINENYNDEKKYIIVDRACEPNYFHWLAQSIPSFCFCQDQFSSEDTVYVFNELKTWQKEILETCKKKKTKVIFLDPNTVYKFNKISILSPVFRDASSTRKQAWFLPNTEILNFRKNIIASITKNQKNHKKIYISRRDQNRRSISNENSIEQKLSGLGYYIIQPEKLSFEEQVSIFNNANIVISATGAALTNLLFCKKGTKIGIIQPVSLKEFCGGYATFAKLLDLEPMVYVEKDDSTRFSVQDSYSISMDYFIDFVKNLESDNFSYQYEYTFEQTWKPKKEKNQSELLFSLKKKIKNKKSLSITLRELALHIEKNDLDTAYKLMSLASELRPGGPFIQKKLNEYKDKLNNE